MPVPLVRKRPESARRGEYCDNCAHASPVSNDDGLPIQASHLRGCSWHEWIVMAAGWCQDWERAR